VLVSPQIGAEGVAESSNGTIKGIGLNSNHAGFYRPSAIAVDPGNSHAHIADGEELASKLRVAVFDRNGRFLQQSVLHRTKTELEAGEGDS
jgi:hypothetical protein